MSLAAQHGQADLPSVTVDAYNAELRDAEGFIGDRASSRAFRAILSDLREQLDADDPLGDTPTEDFSKRRLDRMLIEGDVEAAGVVHGAIEEFAQEFATVIRRFLKLKEWRGTERIVIGGGLRGSRLGELAIGRASVLLQSNGADVKLVPIQHHPDEAGLIGGLHLAPSWVFTGHDSILAMDIGGTNVRAGIVALKLKEAPDMSRAVIAESVHWRHADDKPKRDEAVGQIVAMLQDLIKRAKRGKLHLAPFIAVGCPGVIAEDGSIERGGQNLPGNWEHEHFNLPERLQEAIPQIGGHDTLVVMHNDAVVQGLSQVPFMVDIQRWGVMTIGTGLGNARFTNRAKPGGSEEGGNSSK